MKKFLTVKNLVLVVAFILGLVAFILSFNVNPIIYKGTLVEVDFKNVVWGGAVWPTLTEDKKIAATALPLVGALLVLVGSLAACCLGFFGEKLFKDAKIKMIVAIGCGTLVILGGAFFFATKDSFATNLALVSSLSKENALKDLSDFGPEVASSILGIVSGLAIVAAVFVPNKQLIK